MKNTLKNPLVDLSMITLAAKILMERKDAVYGMDTTSSIQGVHITREAMKQIADEIGIEVRLVDRPQSEYPWNAEITYDGVRFYAIVKPEHLAIFGYKETVRGYFGYNPPPPVKIVQEVTA